MSIIKVDYGSIGGGTLTLIESQTDLQKSANFDTGIPLSQIKTFYLNTKNQGSSVQGYGCAGIVEDDGTVTNLVDNSGYIVGTNMNGNLGFNVRTSSPIPYWILGYEIYNIE